MGNPITHMELCTTDVGAARSFYTELFSWSTKELPEMSYHFIETGSTPCGGIMQLPDPSVPVCWTMYVTVDSVTDSVEKVKALGGTVHKERTEVPGIGFFAIVADPQGGVLGLWEDLSKEEA